MKYKIDILFNYWTDIKKWFLSLFKGEDKHADFLNELTKDAEGLTRALKNASEIQEEVRLNKLTEPVSVKYVLTAQEREMTNTKNTLKPKEFDGNFADTLIGNPLKANNEQNPTKPSHASDFDVKDLEEAERVIKANEAKLDKREAEEPIFKFTEDGELILGEDSNYSISQSKLKHIKKIMYHSNKKKNVNRS